MDEDAGTYEDAGPYEDRAPESVWGGTKGPWWRRGPASAPRLWKYPREKGSPGAPLSTWAVGGTLAMARSDRVEAYGLTTGDPLWTWQPPDGKVLAHASADAPDGVGVVLHHGQADGDGGAEHVRLTGLDIGSGRVLWSREQRADALGSVALGGGLIVTARPGQGTGTDHRRSGRSARAPAPSCGSGRSPSVGGTSPSYGPTPSSCPPRDPARALPGGS